MTERKELIERLREEATLLRDSGFPVTPHLMKQAADMLEADISRQVEVSESTRRIRKSALGTSTCRTQLRAEMIARLRNYNGLSDHDCVCEAAFMLEADAPAVPQEPVAIIRCWTKNGEGHSELVDWCFPGIESLPDGEHKLFAAPQQQPRLTDGEVYTAYIEATNQTLRPQDERLALAFARAIEAKVRGEV